jgi:PAS domain S-box-containing protein
LKKKPGTGVTDLRQRAEDRLRDRKERLSSRADAAKLVHELQVHQIELEMQNEELVRSRGELETSLERYSELYDFAPVGYFTLGRDGAIRDVNLTGARLLGIERAELLTRRIAAFVAAADTAALDAALSRALASQGAASCEVALGQPHDAGYAPIYVQLTVSASESAEECRAIAVDVTERRRAEEQLRAWQKMEAIGRLAGGVAHDFNNLLTVVLTHAGFALGAAGENATLRDDLTELIAAAERAAAITRQLLAFGRKQVLRAQVIDANELVRRVTNMLRRLLDERIELTLALAADLGCVKGDPVQLEQVIMNLVINARDAMPLGGKLTVSTASVDVDETHAPQYPMGRAGSFVLLIVSDSGVGMDKVTMAQAFEPFFTTKNRDRGTGFGLATVYGIVKQCGGDVSVQSELGKGTTFEIYFPRAAEPLTVAAPPAAIAKAPGLVGGTETILIVEDEAALRNVAKRILVSVGYTVLVAESGQEALRIGSEHSGPIHLALSDVVMPKMTGVAFAAQLKEMRPATKVLHMSGYAEEAIGQHGAIDPSLFIGKPFTTDDLTQKIREVLDTQ